VDIRCGECAALLVEGTAACPMCGRTLGAPPSRLKRPGLVLMAAGVAAIEVVLTLVLLRACR
jgi:uncharacterized OB-fold protein